MHVLTQKANVKAFIKNGALEKVLGNSFEFDMFLHLNLCVQDNILANKNPSVEPWDFLLIYFLSYFDFCIIL